MQVQSHDMDFRKLGVGFLTVLCGACSTEFGLDDRFEIRQRYVPDGPRIELDREKLFGKDELFCWSFETSESLGAWELQRLGAAPSEDGGTLFKPTGDDPQMIRPVKLDAAEVHLLEVTLAGLHLGQIELFWADSQSEFSHARRLALEPPRQRDSSTSKLTFNLASHPGWQGEIRKLRLDPTTSLEDAVRVRSICGFRQTVLPERLTRVAEGFWSFDLEGDVRSGRPAIPGSPFELSAEIEPGDRLRLSYGLEPSVLQAVTFLVGVDRPSGSTKTIFKKTLNPADGDAGNWYETVVDIDGPSGELTTFQLTTHVKEPLELARGFPVWANPEILSPTTGDGASPNVLLISIDTLRADRLSAYGHFRETSPHIDAWAGSSAILFRNTVAQAPWTLPSQVSMLTGIDALRHGVNHTTTAPDSLEMLPEVLGREGYATAAITGGGYLRPQYGFSQGFDSFTYWPQILSEDEFAAGLERLLVWLEDHADQRFFLFFHTYEVHYPHRQREPYFSRLTKGEKRIVPRGEILMRGHSWGPSQLSWRPDHFVVRYPEGREVAHLTAEEKILVGQMYDSAIAYVDHGLGRVFRKLEQLRLLDKTLVILTSDHGEALGETDRAGHNYLDDFNVLVPLIITLPDRRGAGTVVDRQVRSIDIVPTVLDYLDITLDQPIDGVSLLDAIEGGADGPPPQAWSYASSANYGLGLRYANRLKYTFNNSAWTRILGQEGLFELGRKPEDERRIQGGGPQLERFRDLVGRTMVSQHRGLRLLIRAGEGHLEGQLTGHWSGIARVKAAVPSCACLTWPAGQGATFKLAPAQEILLFFEGDLGNRIGIAGTWTLGTETPRPFHQVFNPREIGDPILLFYQDGKWQSQERAPGKGEASFTIWNEDRADFATEPEHDSAAWDQLRALGYVD